MDGSLSNLNIKKSLPPFEFAGVLLAWFSQRNAKWIARISSVDMMIVLF